MTAAQPPDQVSSLATLAPALRRLARARALELWVRTAIWVWCTALLAWLLPLDGWSATSLPRYVALAIGAAMAGTGALLASAYGRLSSTAEVRRALVQARRMRTEASEPSTAVAP